MDLFREFGTHHKMNRNKEKRFRIAFTTEQINYMEKQFRKFPYINNGHRKEIAIALNIPEKAVKVWFQNRRMKEKKDTSAKEVNVEVDKLMSLDFFNKGFSNIGKTLNDQEKYSSYTKVKKVLRDKQVTNSALCWLNSKLLGNNSPETNDDRKSNDKIRNPTYFINPILNSPQNLKNIVTEKQINNDITTKETATKDLSLNQRMIHPESGQIQKLNESLSDPRYIFVLPDVTAPTQPCYPAGGILWTPVNVIPAMNPVNVALKRIPSTSVVNPNNKEKISTAHETTTNKCCSCNCHMVLSVAANLQQQSPNAQYIIK